MLRRSSLLPCLAVLGLNLSSLAQSTQVDQARQLLNQTQNSQQRQEVVSQSLPLGGETATDPSFGLQQVLARPEKLRPFRVFGDVTGFATNNAALTRLEEIDDTFLVATFGFEYRRPITKTLQWEATVRTGIFRYNKTSALDFISIDAGTGLTWRVPQLWDLDFFGRYNFTDLINDRAGREFFRNHTLTVGVQKLLPLSQAHYFYGGVAAQFGFAEPSIERRNEYSAQLGYHLQATRRWEADVSYRYAYYDYKDRDRSDNNHGLALLTRYSFTEWLSAYGSAFFGFNRSTVDVFDYDVANLGGGLGLIWRF